MMHRSKNALSLKRWFPHNQMLFIIIVELSRKPYFPNVSTVGNATKSQRLSCDRQQNLFRPLFDQE